MSREELAERIQPLVALLYPEDHETVRNDLLELAVEYAERLSSRSTEALTERTAYLIVYGDSIRRPGETPLHTLAGVLRDRVGDVISDVHLLPIFPWTSDDGFAVVDHRAVNPDLGTWSDVADLARHHRLTLDFVANHTSSACPWFEGWLAGEPAYAGYYIERDDAFDTTHVVRPRTTPLFHRFQRQDGSPVEAWTTFGEDQVDVDVRTPALLLELTDVLLGYLARGATTIRLDAIGFLWKTSGTTCTHLPQTHAVIKLWRALIDHVAPGTLLLTETNVPQADNIAYFGDGHDEASLVYQFALPPLVLHAFVTGSTARLRAWAAGIGPISPTATWFNFLASHDGIGLRPTEGILDDDERTVLVDRTLAHGGRVSMSTRTDGTGSVYELNLGYLDALCTPEEVSRPEVAAAKALAAHSILLAFIGVPALYFHSLFGSSADHEGMEASQINRRINREVLDADRLATELREDPRRRAVFEGLHRMLGVRRGQPAFSPFGTQQVLDLDDRVFAIHRAASEGSTSENLLCLTNVTPETVTLDTVTGHDLWTGSDAAPLTLGPYGFAWILGANLVNSIGIRPRARTMKATFDVFQA